MKSFIVLAICFAAALAAPTSPPRSVEELLERDRHATVVRNDVNNIGVGGYSSIYETDNGIKAQAEATFEAVPLPDGTSIDAQVVRGSFSYIGSNGVIYTVNYVADKDGFQAFGDHLPTV